MFVVSVFDVTMMYGGPEEGGWWWDHRVPVAPDNDYSLLTRRFPNTLGEEAYKYSRFLNDILHSLHGKEFEYEYSSVLGGRKYCAMVQDGGEPYTEPEDVPHYE